MITIAITTYNRTTLLFESFAQVINDDRVTEIVISDDNSRDEVYQAVAKYCKDHIKITLYRNDVNLDCYKNKRQAISLSSNEWVILLDSDNKISKEYIDRVESLIVSGLNPRTIYQPEFARPHFNFEKYSGINITKNNVGKLISDETFQTMLNAANYLVNRDEYLKVWDRTVDPVTSDSIFQAYNWLKSGNSIYVVPGLNYYHRVNNHNGEEQSHYVSNIRNTPHGFHHSIVSKLKEMI